MNQFPLARGFTLVELLVAMFITAILFSIGYPAISQAIRNRDVVAARQDRLLQVQRAMRLFLQDFTELAPRPVREPNAGWQSAIVADARSPALVSLTRGGWANPAGVDRATLQRVRYVLEQNVLYRETFQVLDATLDTKPRRREVIDHVKSVKLRYMNLAHQWQEQWPPAILSNPPQQSDLRMRPIAVEVTIELDDWGKLVRLIDVAG